MVLVFRNNQIPLTTFFFVVTSDTSFLTPQLLFMKEIGIMTFDKNIQHKCGMFIRKLKLLPDLPFHSLTHSTNLFTFECFMAQKISMYCPVLLRSGSPRSPNEEHNGQFFWDDEQGAHFTVQGLLLC